MTKKEALELYLGGNEGEVKEGYNENHFDTEYAEYAVYTDYEADKATEEYIDEFINELGIDGFTEGFRDWIYNNAVDEDFFYQVVDEEIDYQVGEALDDAEELLRLCKEFDVLPEDATEDDLYDGIDDELKTAWLDSIDDYSGYIRDQFGDDEVARLVKENNAYDLGAIVDECISWDGRGHFLSGYDGKEIELQDEDGDIQYYAYRTN